MKAALCYLGPHRLTSKPVTGAAESLSVAPDLPIPPPAHIAPRRSTAGQLSGVGPMTSPWRHEPRHRAAGVGGRVTPSERASLGRGIAPRDDSAASQRAVTLGTVTLHVFKCIGDVTWAQCARAAVGRTISSVQTDNAELSRPCTV